MPTPGWIRKRRRREADETRIARAELHLQALERVEKDQAQTDREWTPRRGMSFASEGEG